MVEPRGGGSLSLTHLRARSLILSLLFCLSLSLCKERDSLFLGGGGEGGNFTDVLTRTRMNDEIPNKDGKYK